ncbi:MAG: RICIN domain-containing protein [Fibrobacterales bacterium]
MKILLIMLGVVVSLQAQAVMIQNVNSGLCLEIEGHSIERDASVVQGKCTGSIMQQWSVEDIHSGRIFNSHSGKHMQLESIAAGANVVQDIQTVNGYNLIQPTDYAGSLELRDYSREFCMAIESASRDIGASVVLSTCSGAPEQVFAFRTINSDDYIDPRDGVVYPSVTIGNQIWMAKNLQYEHMDGTESWCYDDLPENCDTYGRLYTWTAAVGTASSSNPSGVQGLCPDDWHVPSGDEWDELALYIATKNNATGFDNGHWLDIAPYLKSTLEWNEQSKGTDDYSFGMLPGGVKLDWQYKFYIIGTNGAWWTTTEESVSPMYVRIRELSSYNNIPWHNALMNNSSGKRFGRSVRCVKNQDEPPVPPTSPTEFTDTRDGQSYKKVLIGTQTWMAENLNYSNSNTIGYCSGAQNQGNTATCDTYGRMYDWTMAMAGNSSSTSVPSGIRGICPADWHLPSDGEWQVLFNYVDVNNGEDGIGRSLKAETEWMAMPGSDQFGFGALPGGFGAAGGGNYYGSLTKYGLFWSSTESGSKALRRDMRFSDDAVSLDNSAKGWMVSVRCIED